MTESFKFFFVILQKQGFHAQKQQRKKVDFLTGEEGESGHRNLETWFKYLFHGGKTEHRRIRRGAPKDLSSLYLKGTKFTRWGVSSNLHNMLEYRGT